MAIAVAAFLVARRAMEGVTALRQEHRVAPALPRGGGEAPAASDGDPALSVEALKSGRVPTEVLSAWVEFLRQEVAEAANGLNNRLQVIDALRRDLASQGSETPEVRQRLEQLGTELDRASGITRSLLRRVTAFAPDTLPAAVEEWQEHPVPPGHILVIDDDAGNRAVMSRLFERFGHRVTAVSNGLEAYEIVRERDGAFDCIVCDVQMPALGGRSLFEQLEEEWPVLLRRFVFVTGDYTRPESRTFLDRTGQPVVGKPFELTELMNAVRVTLAHSPS